MKAFFDLFKGQKTLTLFLAFCMLAFGGCALAKAGGDFIFGTEEKIQVDDPATPDVDESKLPPVPSPKPGSAPINWLGMILDVLFPSAGAGAIAGSLRLLWNEARKRNLEGMFKAVVVGIKDAVDSAKGGKLNKDALYESIQGARDLFANRDLFDKFVDDIKVARDAELAAEDNEEGEVD